MGGAILAGLRSPEVSIVGGLAVTNRTEAKAAPLRADDVESYALESDPAGNAAAVRGARIVLVAVKPAMVSGLLVDLRDALEPDPSARFKAIGPGCWASPTLAKVGDADCLNPQVPQHSGALRSRAPEVHRFGGQLVVSG